MLMKGKMMMTIRMIMLMVIMNGRWKEEGKLWILILVTNMGKYRCWAAENYNQDA